jgi:small GTP-binding protein
MRDSYKIVALGASGSGKTSIVQRYVNDNFSETQVSTIGAAFQVKSLKYPDGSRLRLNIWDCCGQTRFDSIVPIYYRSANACILVYDITDAQSFERAKNWVDVLFESSNGKMIIALIGNKVDMEDRRVVSKKEGQTFAESKRLLWYEVSAKTNYQVDDSFNAIVKALMVEPDVPDNANDTIKLVPIEEKSRVQTKSFCSSCF